MDMIEERREKMVIIGVTGNSGAGKDTVSEILKSELDAIIINADLIVKENQAPNKDYYNKVVELFGENILNEDNSLNRKVIANIIFKSEEKRNELNKLTFECVQMEVEKILEKNDEKEYVILNFPLLYEGNFDKICKYVIAVTADEDTKIKRITIRDRISISTARQRIESQKTEDFYKSHADFLIDNSCKVDYRDLRTEVVNVSNKIKEKSIDDIGR